MRRVSIVGRASARQQGKLDLIVLHGPKIISIVLERSTDVIHQHLEQAGRLVFNLKTQEIVFQARSLQIPVDHQDAQSAASQEYGYICKCHTAADSSLVGVEGY